MVRPFCVLGRRDFNQRIQSDDLTGRVGQGRTVAEALEIARDVARKLREAQRERDAKVEVKVYRDLRSALMLHVQRAGRTAWQGAR